MRRSIGPEAVEWTRESIREVKDRSSQGNQKDDLIGTSMVTNCLQQRRTTVTFALHCRVDARKVSDGSI
jgi:hypothetical protein